MKGAYTRKRILAAERLTKVKRKKNVRGRGGEGGEEVNGRGCVGEEASEA